MSKAERLLYGTTIAGESPQKLESGVEDAADDTQEGVPTFARLGCVERDQVQNKQGQEWVANSFGHGSSKVARALPARVLTHTRSPPAED